LQLGNVRTYKGAGEGTKASNSENSLALQQIRDVTTGNVNALETALLRTVAEIANLPRTMSASNNSVASSDKFIHNV
jgi:hypothetical protein